MNDVVANMSLGGWRPANRDDALLNDAVDVFVDCVRYFLVGEMVDTEAENRKIELLNGLARAFKLKADRYSDFAFPNSFLDPALVAKNGGLWDTIAGIHASQALVRQVTMSAEARLPLVCFARFGGRHPSMPVRWQLWVRTQRPEPGTLDEMPYVPDWAWAPGGPAVPGSNASPTPRAEPKRVTQSGGNPAGDGSATSPPAARLTAQVETPVRNADSSHSNPEAKAPPAEGASHRPLEPARERSSLLGRLGQGLRSRSSGSLRQPEQMTGEETDDQRQGLTVFVVRAREPSFAPRLLGYLALALVVYFLGLDMMGTIYGGATAILSRIAAVLSGQSLVLFET